MVVREERMMETRGQATKRLFSETGPEEEAEEEEKTPRFLEGALKNNVDIGAALVKVTSWDKVDPGFVMHLMDLGGLKILDSRNPRCLDYLLLKEIKTTSVRDFESSLLEVAIQAWKRDSKGCLLTVNQHRKRTDRFQQFVSKWTHLGDGSKLVLATGIILTLIKGYMQRKQLLPLIKIAKMMADLVGRGDESTDWKILKTCGYWLLHHTFVDLLDLITCIVKDTTDKMQNKIQDLVEIGVSEFFLYQQVQFDPGSWVPLPRFRSYLGTISPKEERMLQELFTHDHLKRQMFFQIQSVLLKLF